ncbi:hypothetical protein DENSPDRAFT_833867 [Dentipellis sp. KUC8613]|nr:hypothetical protein DENSPDRAFT_833867 [Dentipellis sp. KUC8613]
MSSVASPHHPAPPAAFSDYPTHPHVHSSPKSLLASTWQILDQPPPPSLREILGAYRSRGDGDREMLMAMLNAKSAEDQRLASMASLHRSMLEYYQVLPPSHPVAANESPYSPLLQTPQSNGVYHARSNATESSPSRSPRTAREPHSRKRHRSSESPASTYRSAPHSHSSSSPYRAPSPPDSIGSESVDRSPRSRGAMAIGSLLREAAREETNGSRRSSRRDGAPDAAAPRGAHHSNSNSMSTVSV